MTSPPLPNRSEARRLAQLPVDEQLRSFEAMIVRNPLLDAVLDRAAALALPAWYLTAGCLFQTAWNALSGLAPTHGIRDYDLFYFDDADTSWEAEDVVIRRCAEAFGDLGVQVEVRNQARVHLWYPDRFGVLVEPFRTCEDGVDAFAMTTCCVATRRVEGRLRTYAPHGFADLFNLVLRPNPVRAPRAVYEEKARRWSAIWPDLQVLPWPSTEATRIPRPRYPEHA
ncbi:MAG: nucleotidyltransferase family protein [Vicinamibacteraceae bacterium]